MSGSRWPKFLGSGYWSVVSTLEPIQAEQIKQALMYRDVMGWEALWRQWCGSDVLRKIMDKIRA